MASSLQAALRRPPPPLYGELFRCFSALPPRIARAQGLSRAAETAFTHAWTSTCARREARMGLSNDGESTGRAATTSGPSWLAKRTTLGTGTAWTSRQGSRQLKDSVLAIDARRDAVGSRRSFSSSSLRWTAAGPGDGTGSPPAATPTPPRPPDKLDSALPPNGAERDPETTNGRLHSLAKVEPHPLIAPHPAYLSSLSRSIRRAASALPTVAGRPPPKEQLLSLTNSFFERLKIRFKWATIRSYRRFRADDYSAFFSFGIMGTLGWFLLSTTSAFAVFFFLVNSLSLQEWLASKLGAYLTDSTGVKVVFESAIVPKWGLFGQSGSKIVFRNVYISRGPVKGELGILPAEQGQVEETEEQAKLREQMAKWTHFHLSIDTVEVSLSLGRWLDGKGLIKDAAVRGVRGVIERSHIVYDPTAVKDRFQYRNKPRPGDFWLEGLKIEDFLVTIYQPDHFRPYTFSIFNADIPRFRKQWLFYDLMSAEAVTGQVDNCLFSLHKPQSIGTTSEEDLKNEGWSRMSRFRCDGIPIDHMQTSNDTGVLSWITSGRCDLVADIRFPRQDNQVDLSAIVDHLVDEIGGRLGAPTAAQANNNRTGPIPGRRSLSRDALEAPRSEGHELTKKEERRRALQFAKEAEKAEREQQRFAMLDEDLQQERENETEAPSSVEDEEDKIVSIDLDIRFRDLKASVPYFTSDLSYINNALVRPIVAFINRNRTLIPIRCHIDLGLSEFNGSWTTYDVGILDRMSEQVYEALAHHVAQSNDQRIQTVGLWTLQMTASSVLSALKNNFTLAPY